VLAGVAPSPEIAYRTWAEAVDPAETLAATRINNTAFQLNTDIDVTEAADDPPYARSRGEARSKFGPLGLTTLESTLLAAGTLALRRRPRTR